MTLDQARSVTATFDLQTSLLTVNKAGTGNGAVVSDPTGIQCGRDCQESYPNGTSVTLRARAPLGTVFAGWKGACRGLQPTCTVVMTEARSVTAVFKYTPIYLLKVSKAGAGLGTVSSKPAGIDCGSDCSQQYNSGTVVTLTAKAVEGSVFAGWSGACSGMQPNCTVSMARNRTARATFNPLFP